LSRREKLFWLAVGAAFVVGFLFLIPTYEHVCDQRKEAGEQNCTSYQITRLAVGKIAEFLDLHNWLVTALFAGLVTLFTWRLWQATNELRVSTDGLWQASTDALETTERAFVFLDGFDVELSLAPDREGGYADDLPERYKSYPELYITRFAVQPRWKNGGNTPTKKMTIQVDWRGPPAEVPPTKYVHRNPPIPFFLAPKAVERSSYFEIPPAPAIVDWQMTESGPEKMILIWGRADYEDVFGNKHFVEWCHKLRFSRPGAATERMSAGFIQWREHNRTDDG
jgi:hypothetical protein